ncbi:hypothetical protein ACFVS9_01235 [Streptomyces sp. NPDC058008]|uniref:hypothetical protein n=1 Tax=Streptomyces sp. NPDC058008 TaxID=3346303 RepID=UPI0036EE0FEC
MKETGKALVAWDEWGDNPSRAAGAVTFNVVTTVFTGGTGGAVAGGGKAALAAKALSVAGKVGRFVDPMTYVFKGAGFGLTKIGDAMAGLKGLGAVEIPPLPDNVFTLPEGAVRLPDGTLDLPARAAIPEGAVRLADGTVELPEGVIALPKGTVKLPDELAALTEEGTVKSPSAPRAAYWDLEGNLYDEGGNLLQRSDEVSKEAGKADFDADTPDHARVETPAPQPVPVGAGARGGSNIGDGIRLGDNLRDFGRVGDDAPAYVPAGHTPGGRIPDNTPTNHLDNTPRGSDRTDGPSATGRGGGPAGAGTHMDGPDVGGRNEPPTGGGGTHPHRTGCRRPGRRGSRRG